MAPSVVTGNERGRKSWRARLISCVTIASIALSGCGNFHVKLPEHYVYVTAKQSYLRDRVAAVSNRTGTVTNGEKLVLLEKGKRFDKVKSPRGEVGWIDEKAIVTEATANTFIALGKQHAMDPEVAAATVRDEVYLHIAPGRDTDRFYRLNEGDKLSLLAKASMTKATPGAPAAPTPAPEKTPDKNVGPKTAAKGSAKTPDKTTDAAVPNLPVLEDWWLARDKNGQTGWIYGHMIDVDAPEALTRYAEGQRIVGAYVLTVVNDPDSGVLKDGVADPSVPVYVTVLSPYKAGLPYDFDQVRVFTWNLKKHRYETAFREHNIEGYLPLTITQAADPYGHGALATEKLPEFSYKVLAADAPAPVPDAATGIVTPGKTITKTYRLEGNITQRVLAPGTTAPEEAHPVPEEKKDKKKKTGSRK